jgi:DNA-binding SARP family transcriptional activator
MIVETPAGPIDREWLSERPGQLLRYLVCERGRFVPVDQIVEALWPRADARTTDNVRYLVHQLRRRLEPDRPNRGRSECVECRRGAYALSENVWLDVNEFEHLVRSGLAAHAAGDPVAALTQIDKALELYRGDFLADEPYADWAVFERDVFRSLVEDALRAAADIAEQAGDVRSATAYVRRLADLLRYDSDVQLRLLTLCLLSGRRSEALRRYDVFRARLLRDFGEEPGFDLADAAAAITNPSPEDLLFGVSVDRARRIAEQQSLGRVEFNQRSA